MEKNIRFYWGKNVLISFLAVLMGISLNSCMMKVQEDFERSSKLYNEMLRWNDFYKASIFAVPSLRDEFEEMAKDSKDVMVVDYRVIDILYDGEKGKASVKTEIDYYVLPSFKVKTIEYNQEWVYREDNGKKQWCLLTLMPEFK